MVVTDPQLRDFRNKNYRDSPDFHRGYQYVMTHYAERDFMGTNLCATLPLATRRCIQKHTRRAG